VSQVATICQGISFRLTCLKYVIPLDIRTHTIIGVANGLTIVVNLVIFLLKKGINKKYYYCDHLMIGELVRLPINLLSKFLWKIWIVILYEIDDEASSISHLILFSIYILLCQLCHNREDKKGD